MKTKTEAEYTEHADKIKILLGTGGCINCKHYHSKTMTCTIVEGQILPTAGCKYFKKREGINAY